MTLEHHARSEESHETLAARGRAALERLARYGIDVPGTSRFPAYLARIESLAGDAPITLPQGEIHELQFYLRELDELAAIVESFPRDIGREARERLRIMISGAEHPDAETSSAARDAQWELYLRALLRRAQIPAGLGSPDIVARVLRREVAIEAKRPKSEKRLDDRLRKGVSQLEAAGTPGFVAFSLDHAIRDGRGVLLGPSLGAVEAEVGRLVSGIVQRNLRQIVARIAHRPVLGLIFHARVPTWIKPLSRPQLVTVNHVEPISGDSTINAITDRLLEGLAKG